MVRQFSFTLFVISLMISLPLEDCCGRGGRGGGGRGGGGRGGFSGGGSRGGFSGGGGNRYSGAGNRYSGGGRSSSRMGGGGFTGNARATGGYGASGAGRAGVGGRGASGAYGGRAGNGGLGAGRAGGGVGQGSFNRPSSSQLGSFLGMPSDVGLHSLGASGRSAPSQLPAGGGNFDVNHGTTTGPRGGQIGGATITGPGGNTAGRAVGVGPNGGVGTASGIRGAGGGTAIRGAGVGPGGRAAAGRAVAGPGGAAAAGGIVAGRAGVAAGFARVTPSGRYRTAAAVRTNYNHWGIYNRRWYANYPGAWFAAGWAANAIWNPCTWNTAASYCGYSDVPPVYYDYGNNITYDDNNVYVNGDDVGTAEQYYDQAADLAATGAKSEAPADGDWLPLGVFALTKPDETKSDVTIQLAVNKEGVIRGNSTDTATNKNQVIQGSVDKKTQKVAFTVGDHPENVVETGIYNLTKDEAPILIHFGKDRTEQWLLVRLHNPDTSSGK